MTNIAAKLGAHALITLGATIAVWAFVGLPGDAAVIVWLVFTAADMLADWLLLSPAHSADARPAVLDYFEEA